MYLLQNVGDGLVYPFNSTDKFEILLAPSVALVVMMGYHYMMIIPFCQIFNHPTQGQSIPTSLDVDSSI